MKRTLALMFGLIFLSGCMGHQFGPIEPLEPKMTSYVTHTMVSSLRPRFQWSDSQGTPSTVYDLAIWESVVTEDRKLIPGERVHFREGITGTSYTLDTPLKPRMIYLWSVRRSSDSSWTTVRSWYAVATPIGSGAGSSNKYFIFNTPEH